MPSQARVLIADDNPGVVKSISRLLSLEHDVVGSAENGRALLDAAERLRPDVIVLDLSFADVDSLDVCRRLTKSHPEIKVVVFTIENNADVRRSALEAGASAFVHKLAGDALLSEIERVFGGANNSDAR